MKRFNGGGMPRFRFMEGRYGSDEFGRFLSVAACVSILLSLILHSASFVSSLLTAVGIAMLVICYGRILSKKNMARRLAENQKYLQLKMRVTDWFSLKKTCFQQRREFAFFRCPGCGRTMRVPRGKGKLRITCRHCGYTFEKKT